MKKILIVDDMKMVTFASEQVLQDAGYEVYVAHNGLAARQLLESGVTDIDLVITDIVMPVMDGVDLIVYLGKTFPGVPIVAMSGGGAFIKREEVLEPVASRVTKVMNKPFTKAELLEVAAECLKDS